MSTPAHHELRELDAWIAEYVMGWQWWRFHIKGKSANGKKRVKWCQLVPPNERWPINSPKWNGALCKCAVADMEDATDLSMFKPTTDPAAAMQVLEKCLIQLNSGGRVLMLDEQGGTFSIQDNSARYPLTIGQTLPIAICKFAKALFSK